MTSKIQSQKVRYMCLIAVFIAIELLLKLSGLGNIPINPVLNVTLLTIPVAIGAILLGPLAGTILGAVFGATSFIQPMSPMVAAFIPISLPHTIVLCVVMRAPRSRANDAVLMSRPATRMPSCQKDRTTKKTSAASSSDQSPQSGLFISYDLLSISVISFQ